MTGPALQLLTRQRSRPEREHNRLSPRSYARPSAADAGRALPTCVPNQLDRIFWSADSVCAAQSPRACAPGGRITLLGYMQPHTAVFASLEWPCTGLPRVLQLQFSTVARAAACTNAPCDVICRHLQPDSSLSGHAAVAFLPPGPPHAQVSISSAAGLRPRCCGGPPPAARCPRGTSTAGPCSQPQCSRCGPTRRPSARLFPS